MLLNFIARHIGLMLLVAFGLLGVWVLDDYGAGLDTEVQRDLAGQALDYVLGNVESVWPDYNRFYGVAFELPLLLTELALGLEDTPEIHLMRHLISHMFFLAGGLFCYLLARRLFESRLLAVLAMLLFLLHPRIYAHSFFNSKDVPFLSMFMICLYLTHRAFDRDSRWWWFALCGAGSGLLVNLRIMGVVLPAAVVAMLLLDLISVPEGRDRRRILANMAVFVMSTLLMLYAVSPFLWSDPVGSSVEWFAQSARHIHNDNYVFRGEWFFSRDYLPPEYVPVWFSITTPPAVLALGMVGISALVLRGFAAPMDVLRDTRLRFWLMLVGCFVLPIVAVMVLNSNIYNGWRQMYFLHAPFCLLAVFGARWTFSFFRGSRLRFSAYGAVGAGVAAVAVSMVAIHPDQQVYFTFLVDRTTPEHLRTRYQMDYWSPSMRHGLSHLLERHPSRSVYIETHLDSTWWNRYIFPAADRHRLFVYRHGEEGEFSISDDHRPEAEGAEIYWLKVYSNTIFTIRDLASAGGANVDDAHRRIHLDATSSDGPIIDSRWDVHLMDGQLVYVRESCSVGDGEDRFFLHVVPADVSDLPEERRQSGFDNLSFDFQGVGAAFDGKCVAKIDLPGYPVERIATGQHSSREGRIWQGWWNVRAAGVYDAFRESRKSVLHPAISSVFDVYLDDGELIYAKSSCTDEDREARFFLHLTPADVSDLHEERREPGFDNLNFDLWEHGGGSDGDCFAVVDLPAYEIASISTGQYTPDGLVWSGRYSVAAAAAVAAARDLLEKGVQPAVSSVFDVYIDDGELIYAKSPCTDADREARFFLHVNPIDVSDLPEGRREPGFDNLDFNLWEHGGGSDGDCFAVVELPEYRIASMSTGQYTAEGLVWSGRYSVAAAAAVAAARDLLEKGVQPAVSSVFDVYIDDGELIYAKQSCTDKDREARFFLHLIPADVSDLPEERKESGFDNLDFNLLERGGESDGACFAVVDLPEYEIAEISTGQYTSDGRVWGDELEFGSE